MCSGLPGARYRSPKTRNEMNSSRKIEITILRAMNSHIMSVEQCLPEFPPGNVDVHEGRLRRVVRERVFVGNDPDARPSGHRDPPVDHRGQPRQRLAHPRLLEVVERLEHE